MENVNIKVSIEVQQQQSWSDTRTIAKVSVEHGGTFSHAFIEMSIRKMLQTVLGESLQQVHADEVVPEKTADKPEPAAIL